jgi:hypothetical protein
MQHSHGKLTQVFNTQPNVLGISIFRIAVALFPRGILTILYMQGISILYQKCISFACVN